MVVGEKSHSVGKAAGTMNSDSFNNANYGDFKIRNTEGNLKYPKSIWTFQKPHPSVAIHPTQKPLDLCRYIIRTYSNKGDLVLDCCCGSGTIPMAAKMENRNYIGMDNGYCEKPNTEYDGKSWAEISTMRLKNVGKKLF